MRLLDAYQKLEKLDQVTVQTRDFSALLGIDIAHASKLLERLAAVGLMVSVVKGLWAFPKRMDPLLLPRYLAAPFPCYVSLQTALLVHDMILQIPTVTYAVSLARTKRFVTPLGEVSLHHIDPSFFFGFEVDQKSGIALATPEKAILDMLYLSSSKTHLFGTLPEVELPKGFSEKKAKAMIERIPSKQRRTLVLSRFEQFLKTTFSCFESS